jgi:hypothetical protein
MEIFPPLSGFYQAIADDARISSTHISIYMALLQQWNITGGNNPVKIERSIIMKAAKINARQTYNKCINELQEFGYIRYVPAPNGSINSQVYLIESNMKK